MLNAWTAGDASALERLTPIVYTELHRLARRNLAGEREGHLLQPSALVNEAFVRLMSGAPLEWTNRAQFFAISARLMRQVLVDFARAQDAVNRGRRATHVDLSGIRELHKDEPDPVEFLDLNTALDGLAALSARQAQVVELRYFGGLENQDIARMLEVSEATVLRDWRLARVWLYSRLHPQGKK